MAIAVKIDLDNVYKIKIKSGEFDAAIFKSELANGGVASLAIEISCSTSHELVPNVYNLGFGPVGANGDIDDKAHLKHKDYSKVFSTILFYAKAYLDHYPDRLLGIDGSDMARANLYYRFILNNFEYLNNYFIMAGLKYYVRITRFGKLQYENPFDFGDVKPMLETITEESEKHPEFMYNYFLFTKL